MRRKLLFLCLVLLTFPLLTVSAAARQVSVTIDGAAVVYDSHYGYPYVDENSRTQVPFRRTLETFGCVVTWDEKTYSAVAVKDGVTVRVPIGQRYILVNGDRVDIDTVSAVINGRTYLPIRAVVEAFGAYVTWDDDLWGVVITTGGNLVRIHFIDVGQGDAALIDCGQTEVLIDGGDNKAGPTVVSYLKPYVDGKLDYLIATHPDADHIGGLPDVFASYDVGEVIDSGYTASSKTYQNYLTAARSEPGCTFSYDEDRTILLGPSTVLSVIETGDDWTNANDSSAVCQLTCGNIRVLFTGDISQTVERQCLSLFGDVDVLKVGHHGSSTSTCKEFLSVIKPEYAVISYKTGNSYHHPTPSALKRLFTAGATVYGTGKSGAVVLTTDGQKVSFNTSNALTLADAGT